SARQELVEPLHRAGEVLPLQRIGEQKLHRPRALDDLVDVVREDHLPLAHVERELVELCVEAAELIVAQKLLEGRHRARIDPLAQGREVFLGERGEVALLPAASRTEGDLRARVAQLLVQAETGVDRVRRDDEVDAWSEPALQQSLQRALVPALRGDPLLARPGRRLLAEAEIVRARLDAGLGAPVLGGGRRRVHAGLLRQGEEPARSFSLLALVPELAQSGERIRFGRALRREEGGILHPDDLRPREHRHGREIADEFRQGGAVRNGEVEIALRRIDEGVDHLLGRLAGEEFLAVKEVDGAGFAASDLLDELPDAHAASSPSTQPSRKRSTASRGTAWRSRARRAPWARRRRRNASDAPRSAARRSRGKRSWLATTDSGPPSATTAASR